jgi:hypothetical protein
VADGIREAFVHREHEILLAGAWKSGILRIRRDKLAQRSYLCAVERATNRSTSIREAMGHRSSTS